MLSDIIVHGVVVADRPWTPIEHIQAAFDVKPDTTSYDRSYVNISASRQVPWQMRPCSWRMVRAIWYEEIIWCRLQHMQSTRIKAVMR